MLALPRSIAVGALGLLTSGVIGGATLLVGPSFNEATRAAGGQILVVSLPSLAVAMVVIGGSRGRTGRIDAMVARFLRQTVGDKLEAYLLPPRKGESNPYFPPLFVRMERRFNAEITSYCHYCLFDQLGRQFDILVKSNVFNIEVSFLLLLVRPPEGWTPEMNGCDFVFQSIDDWPRASTNPLANLASESVYGSLSEGYSVLVDSSMTNGSSLRVRFRLRQRRQDNFLTSPYLRRFFAEDIALAMYYIYKEVLADESDTVLGGTFSAS